jgi:CubicO group peptidase (beta-lactamase class C family)
MRGRTRPSDPVMAVRLAAAVPLLALAGLAGCAAGETRASAADGLSTADSLQLWYTLGINAHHLCAGYWVVGRDLQRTPAEVVAQDIAPFAFQWSDAFEYAVDEVAATVTLSTAGVDSRTAKYNLDQGCTILTAGADDVFFEPRSTASTLPDPATQDWPMGDRGARGEFPEVDGAALERALDHAFDDEALDPAQNTRGLVVVYRGKIVAERYAEGWGPYTPQLSWSMGKSIAAALMGVLVEQGEYELHQPAPVPEWQGARDPRRNIRISDLLRMSSGLDFDNFGARFVPENEHWRIYFDAVDVHLHAINQPPRWEPNTLFRYRNSDPLTLMYLAKRAVEARGEDFLLFPQRHLFDRIGMRSMVLETDPWGNFIITGYDFGGSRDWARFGLLHLWDGVWQGERILPEGWVEFISTPAPGDPSQGYGGQFWLNRGGSADRLPPDAFWAAGHMGQQTMVIPSRDVVIVRHGPSPGGSGGYLNRVMGDILDAIGERAHEAGSI